MSLPEVFQEQCSRNSKEASVSEKCVGGRRAPEALIRTLPFIVSEIGAIGGL